MVLLRRPIVRVDLRSQRQTARLDPVDPRNPDGNGAISRKWSRPWPPMCAEHMEAVMTRLSLIAVLTIWLGCSAGVAQVNLAGMTIPDMAAAQPLDGVGAPSPIGAMGSATGTGAPTHKANPVGVPIPVMMTGHRGNGAPGPDYSGRASRPNIGRSGARGIIAGPTLIRTSGCNSCAGIDPAFLRFGLYRHINFGSLPRKRYRIHYISAALVGRHGASAPSPRFRGEGRGEGAYPQF
jgi:hypothetical protein